MSEAIDRVSAFVDAHETQWGTEDALGNQIEECDGADGRLVTLMRADLREVLRLARIGAALVPHLESLKRHKNRAVSVAAIAALNEL